MQGIIAVALLIETPPGSIGDSSDSKSNSKPPLPTIMVLVMLITQLNTLNGILSSNVNKSTRKKKEKKRKREKKHESNDASNPKDIVQRQDSSSLTEGYTNTKENGARSTTTSFEKLTYGESFASSFTGGRLNGPERTLSQRTRKRKQKKKREERKEKYIADTKYHLVTSTLLV
ncbi:hypothetical protein ANTQUA_LOCUS1405 [Anthophora quadrimaculata]